MKKTNKKTKKTTSLVYYVDNSTPGVKIFETEEQAKKFISKFNKNSKLLGFGPEDGYWVDLLITDIKGQIKSLDTLELDYDA